MTINLHRNVFEERKRTVAENYFETKAETDFHLAFTDRGSADSTIIDRICRHIHVYWEDGIIPHNLKVKNVRYGVFTAEAFLETFNDPDDEIYRILVSLPTPDHVKISIPVHLRLSNISAGVGITPQSPMGVLARISLTTPAIRIGNFVTAPLSIAVVKMERLDGGIAVGRWLIGAPYDHEGTNYRLNKQGGALFGLDLEALLVFHLVSFGRELAANIGDIRISLPVASTEINRTNFSGGYISRVF